MEDRFQCSICVDLLMLKQENDKLKVLLMRRKNTGFNDGEYELPGGHLESDEDLFDAMLREISEELLIDAKREDLEIAHLMHHFSGRRINVIFKINGESFIPAIGEPEKCDKLEWFDLNNLPKNTSAKMKKIIENVSMKKFYDKM